VEEHPRGEHKPNTRQTKIMWEKKEGPNGGKANVGKGAKTSPKAPWRGKKGDPDMRKIQPKERGLELKEDPHHTRKPVGGWGAKTTTSTGRREKPVRIDNEGSAGNGERVHKAGGGGGKKREGHKRTRQSSGARNLPRDFLSL